MFWTIAAVVTAREENLPQILKEKGLRPAQTHARDRQKCFPLKQDIQESAK
ncbi:MULTISPECIES: hypothetical protein [Arthrobacter]|uniref:hypothetical protein n=1 Tax=Arthrobacter TaxID=1663 RepID=UPI001554DE12|nr:hypothetical protein [Arthrobacter globiformis]